MSDVLKLFHGSYSWIQGVWSFSYRVRQMCSALDMQMMIHDVREKHTLSSGL